MTIFTPDDSEVSEIVLPDGSQASEVVAPDGSVVWTAAPDIPDSVIDNFEEDPSGIYASGETLTYYWSGGANYSLTTSDVVEGSRAVENTDTSFGFTYISSVEGDGLNTYPSAGDTVGWLIRDVAGGGTNYPGVGWRWGGGDRGYECRIRADDNTIRLINRDPSFNDLGAASATIDNGTWYWGEYDVPDGSGDMEYRLYEVDTSNLSRGSLLGTVSATDTTHSSAGVALTKNGDSPDTHYDWLRVL